jgi:hypothetical protein
MSAIAGIIQDRESRTKIKWFSQLTIEEIEKLIKSLNQEITKWKVNNM